VDDADDATLAGLGGLDHLEHHREPGGPRSGALADLGPQAHSGEGRLENINARIRCVFNARG
jgi:hypothetical protein